MENLKGRLVARKTKLPLKLHGGHAGRLTGDQISGPEPDVQRRGKVAGTRVANAGMGDRRGREHPRRAPLYPVCAHSSPSGCGCKPDRQALFFALLEKFARMGIPPHVLAGIEVELIDINERALRFVSDQIESLSRAWAIKFSNIKLTCSDFLDSNIESASKPIVFFGNPPFVLNQRGFSQWKNLFADFLKFALNAAGSRGAVQFILPISIAFSRDYRTLRRDLRDTQCKISLSHFDNIPDTLFKAGKPRHINTNKANSQRCSILTVIPSNSLRIHSTELQRWSKKEREAVLSRSPRYFDVTDYAFDDQTPRPKNECILGYLGQSANPKCFQDWCDPNGKFSLSVAAVARNYIGIREIAAPGVHEIRFETKADFYRALLLLSSDLFLIIGSLSEMASTLPRPTFRVFPLIKTCSKNLQESLPIRFRPTPTRARMGANWI